MMHPTKITAKTKSAAAGALELEVNLVLRHPNLDPQDSRLRRIYYGSQLCLLASTTKMSSSLLHPPAHLSPEVALRVSQQAPAILRDTPKSITPYAWNSLWTTAESPELWSTYENLMLSCLRTGDEDSARLCLGRLTERFGITNERLLALVGLYDESTAKTEGELNNVLKSYENLLKNDPTNTVCLEYIAWNSY